VVGTTVLNSDFSALLQEIEKLDKVMALTRNDECVHERKGVYLNPDFSNPHGKVFVGEDIDLRIFINSWKFGFRLLKAIEKASNSSGKMDWHFTKSI